MISTLLILQILGLTVGGLSNDGRCVDSKCGGLSPCCSDTDWCGRGPLYCGGGCQAGKSTGCFKKLGCVSKSFDFKNSSVIVDAFDLKNNMYQDRFIKDTGSVTVTGDGISLDLISKGGIRNGRKIGEGARLSTVMYVTYGEISATIKVAPGQGVVTAFITMADEKDEIDFEMLGKDVYTIETNYYYEGILDYTKGMKHRMNVDLSANFYTYKIRWSPSQIEWLFEGTSLRVLKRNSSSDPYPYRPSRVQLGIWDGASMAHGTMEWAGATDWETRNKYHAYVKQLNVTCLNSNSKISINSATTARSGYALLVVACFMACM